MLRRTPAAAASNPARGSMISRGLALPAARALSRKTLTVTRCAFSTEEVRDAFKDIFKKYYDDNYRNALFSRMKKDVVKATDANADGVISEVELRQLLSNIGAEMKDEDIAAIMAIENADGQGIPAQTFLKLLG